MDQDQLTRIEKKIDRLDERQDRMELVQVAQHVTLEEHTRRSTANEEAVKLMREEFKPVRKHVDMMNGALKLLGLIVAVLGAVSGIAELIVKILPFLHL